MTNDMHLGIERTGLHHPYGVLSESDCRLSAGVSLHSTTCLSSCVPTGLQQNPVGVKDIMQAVSTPAGSSLVVPSNPVGVMDIKQMVKRSGTPAYTPEQPIVIAGPCSVESEAQILATAQALAKIPEVTMLRGGIWKPRTRPDAFEGRGEQGLVWLRRPAYGLLEPCRL